MLNFRSSSSTNQEEQVGVSSAFRLWTLVCSAFDMCLSVVDFVRLTVQTLLNWTPTSPFILEEVEQKLIARKAKIPQ
jgi:hypothetical protein